MVKEPACQCGKALRDADSLQEGMATHSSIFAWRIPRAEEPGRLQSMGHKESDTAEVTEHALHIHFKTPVLLVSTFPK